MSAIVKTGLDRVEALWPKHLLKADAGLVVHPASVNRHLVHASDIMASSKKFRLKAFFGPQHGIRGETQDNMVEWEGFRDKRTGLPVFSLYGETRKPGKEMLRDIDLMVVDLQDVGARYYTFIWTLGLIMEACLEAGKSVVILDRPNPIGGDRIEGPVLKEGFSSFVGLRPFPVRHGMTIGEIGLYLRDHYYQRLDLHVIPMSGWRRSAWFEDTGLPWVFPSPNMPTVDTAAVYPGMCLLEGTNVSEGRGTTRPFEIFGAPWIDPDGLLKRLGDYRLPGVLFRPLYFLPTFQKHAGKLCGGAQIHVTDRAKFRPFLTGVGIVKAIYDLYPQKFAWKQPPYEYEERLLPIDILAGDDRLRKDIESGSDLHAMEVWWREELRAFDRKVRRNYLLYS
ncbi:MAG: DUF1343 domain-containing protein [Nitrospiraceae bacterium]|nr:DUF1343 domain-containing protein [Nitrospiraceae bacterium]